MSVITGTTKRCTLHIVNLLVIIIIIIIIIDNNNNNYYYQNRKTKERDKKPIKKTKEKQKTNRTES